MHLLPTQKEKITHKLGDVVIDRLTSPKSRTLDPEFLNELMHNAGHDLRSPIFVVRSYAELLQRTQEKERLDRGFKLIQQATHTMEGIITSMIQLMDIYTLPRPAAERLSFRQIFAKAKSRLMNEIQLFEPTFVADFQECPEVHFSKDYLIEILANLLDNAMRHNPRQGDLEIEIRSFVRDGRPMLQVSDNGKGIELAKPAEKVKQPFFSISDDSNCYGMGLSKIQAIAQIYQATFEIENQEGSGTVGRFCF